jgi:hypothetical protein
MVDMAMYSSIIGLALVGDNIDNGILVTLLLLLDHPPSYIVMACWLVFFFRVVIRKLSSRKRRAIGSKRHVPDQRQHHP